MCDQEGGGDPHPHGMLRLRGDEDEGRGGEYAERGNGWSGGEPDGGGGHHEEGAERGGVHVERIQISGVTDAGENKERGGGADGERPRRQFAPGGEEDGEGGEAEGRVEGAEPAEVEGRAFMGGAGEAGGDPSKGGFGRVVGAVPIIARRVEVIGLEVDAGGFGGAR